MSHLQKFAPSQSLRRLSRYSRCGAVSCLLAGVERFSRSPFRAQKIAKRTPHPVGRPHFGPHSLRGDRAFFDCQVVPTAGILSGVKCRRRYSRPSGLWRNKRDVSPSLSLGIKIYSPVPKNCSVRLKVAIAPQNRTAPNLRRGNSSECNF